jgi:acyl-CoA synthetase (NDP forming)
VSSDPSRLGSTSRVFHPRSIALVGASESNFYARSLVENLRRAGYAGRLVGIHPTRASAFGFECVKSLASCADVDVAVLAVNRSQVEETIREAVDVGVKGAVILAAGFRDSGEPEWVEAEQRIASLTIEAGMLVAGPNCLGILSQPGGAVMYGAPVTWRLDPGRVGLIVQSGGLLPGACRYLSHLGAPVRYAVSSGNATCTSIARWVEEVLLDPEVSAIGIIAEGVDDWPRFRKAVEAARSSGRFVGICKLGRSALGQTVAYSHTGALAGEYAIYRDAFEQIGVSETRTLGELMVSLALAHHCGEAKQRSLGIISHSGGAIGQLADLCDERGIALPPPLPASPGNTADDVALANTSNPIDVSRHAMSNLAHFSTAVRTFLRDPTYAVVFYVSSADIADGTIPVNFEQLRTVLEATDLEERFIVISRLTYSPLTEATLQLVAEHSRAMLVPSIDDALGGFVGWVGGSTPTRTVRALSQAYGGEDQWRNEFDVKEELAKVGITSPTRAFLAASGNDAGSIEWPSNVQPPAAVKGVGRLIHHKTRLGLIQLRVATAEELEAAVRRMDLVAREAGLLIDGYLIEEMISGGSDLIVSFSRQPIGQVVMIGRGGVDVESEVNRWFAVLPVNDSWLELLLHRAGVDDPAEARRAKVLVQRLGDFFDAHDLDVLECNPVRVGVPGGPFVLDVLAMPRKVQSPAQ